MTLQAAGDTGQRIYHWPFTASQRSLENLNLCKIMKPRKPIRLTCVLCSFFSGRGIQLNTLVPMQDRWWQRCPPGAVLSPRIHQLCGQSGAVFQVRIVILTERVGVLPDGKGETAAGVVDAEKDHGHVLRGAHASPQGARVAVIHVALVQRQRVVLGAGELLSLHHPAIKHLHGTIERTFGYVRGRTVDSGTVRLTFELRWEIWQQVV